MVEPFKQAEKRVKIDVPFVVQKKDMCSEASASMILKYYNFDLSQDKIAEMGCPAFEGMENCLNKFLKCERKFTQTIKNLKQNIDRSKPVIVRIIPKGQTELHSIIVTGYEKDKLIVNDPAIGTTKISEKEFIDLWRASNYSAIYCEE